MPRKMLQFTHLARRMPEKRPAEERATDFAEIYKGFAHDRAAEQASRCEQCGIPFCQIRCPLGNHIPDWLMLTAQDRLEEAYEVSAATNSFPEICGRICPQDRLCEGNCVLEQSTHHAVTIGAVERYVTETAFFKGWVAPPKPVRDLSQSVGIIGGGPGGLAAAARLRKMGYQVTVYDRHDRMGGLLMYGIPGFKLEKSVVERRTRLLAEAGIVLKPNVDVGKTISFNDLRAAHDAVLIATGVYQARALDIPGHTLPGVLRALDYLITANKVDLGDHIPDFQNGTLNAKDKDVVVIGGGDTAMDCVRTALRQGARSVKCLYRRDRQNMPGSQREVAHAEEEGADFIWMAAPIALDGADAVTSVQAVKMHLGVADASGRQSPQIIAGSEFTIPADMVIQALGFEPEPIPSLFQQPDLHLDRWNGIKVAADGSGQTSLDGVFAAGDIVRGASLVVWAIKDGRDAADGIAAYLTAKSKRQAAE